MIPLRVDGNLTNIANIFTTPQIFPTYCKIIEIKIFNQSFIRQQNRTDPSILRANSCGSNLTCDILDVNTLNSLYQITAYFSASL